MPHFDRLDICVAYYHYACICRNYGEVCAIMDKLDRIRFRPGLSDSKLATISLNAKAIYMQLIRLHWSKK